METIISQSTVPTTSLNRGRKSRRGLLFTALLLLLPNLTLAALAAQEGEAGEGALVLGLSQANVLWLFLGGILVFFMQAGFASLEMGLVRAKNAANIMMKNLTDCCVGVLSYWLIGWALMFYLGKTEFGTNVAMGWFSGSSVSSESFTTLFFQAAFAATASTIVSGAIAERAKFNAYVAFAIMLSGLIYPYLGSWTWGGGWLAEMGFHDFAGSTVVHGVGGWAALVGAAMLGARQGKYVRDENGKILTIRAIPGHSMPLATLGTFFLFFGWFGFNAVSTLDASSDLIGLIVLNTAIAACTGTIGAMLISRWTHGKPDASMSLNGMLAGLVGITAGCDIVDPGAALIIGFVSGVIVVLSIEFIDKKLCIDDPVGAISVHGICGAFGTLAVGFFANDAQLQGLFFGGGGSLLGVQLIGVGAIMIATIILSFIMFSLIKLCIGLRVSDFEERKGLDITEHGTESYYGFQIFSNL
ncbi:ammonium transporter [Candidatus Haliotispira prima]|uniref:Ammonium transporter n=1 Tax=Candidatus Haliotispira prima TaxID=3034016 RepID=A0ABY8MFQ4_9SPIO|nr:ammonium transporter [Candidatus Haliotispira prima]